MKEEEEEEQSVRAMLAGVEVDSDGDHEDGAEPEEYDGVDDDGGGAGPHAVELGDAAIVSRDLAQQPRREHHEQGHSDQHRAPIARPHGWISPLSVPDPGKQRPRRRVPQHANQRRRHRRPHRHIFRVLRHLHDRHRSPPLRRLA